MGGTKTYGVFYFFLIIILYFRGTGLLTYVLASPEKNQPSSIYEASQESARRDRASKEDVWSLGCVLSVVATWVVLGAEGVIQYNKIRQKAHHKRSGIISDSFHNGSQVIQEVTAWHQYLRAAARRTDTISSLVLNMIDNDMLVGVDSRHNTAGIVKGFAEHLAPTGTCTDGFPEEISDLLLEIDEEERQGAAFKELHPSTESEWGGFALPTVRYTESDSASARELLSQRTKPTVQRLPQRTPQQSGPDSVSRAFEDSESENEAQVASNFDNCDTLTSPLTTIFTLEQEINEAQGGGLLSRFRKRPKSVREQKQAAKDDELKKFFENRDIVGRASHVLELI